MQTTWPWWRMANRSYRRYCLPDTYGLKINLEKTEVLHRPPVGRAEHRAGVEEPDLGGQFRVPRRGSVRRREDRVRGTSKSIGRN